MEKLKNVKTVQDSFYHTNSKNKLISLSISLCMKETRLRGMKH